MTTTHVHLAEADRHIADAEARLLRQHELAKDLARDGHADAAARAEDLLGVMEQAIEGMREHRAVIVAELNAARTGDAQPSP